LFRLTWTDRAKQQFEALEAKARREFDNRRRRDRSKWTKAEGLFKQLAKTVDLLRTNPRHPSLQTHEFMSLDHPFDLSAKVFGAYARHRTPGAYRVFWCYGPDRDTITIIAITPHP